MGPKYPMFKTKESGRLTKIFVYITLLAFLSITVVAILASQSAQKSLISIIEKLTIEETSKSPDISSLYEFKMPKFKEDTEKKEKVKQAFLHAWNHYSAFCWGHDELIPGSKHCTDTLHAGLTIVDSLSTLWIMDLKDEFQKARDYVEKDFKPNGSWNSFEFIIRFLGGFLSAYDLTGDELFLRRAKECGDAIYDSMNGVFPPSGINIKTDNDGNIKFRLSGGYGNLAMRSTFQLEFAKLTEITKDPKYLIAALNAYKEIWGQNPNKAILETGSLGACYDSYYEYIIKVYLMTNGTSEALLNRHIMMMNEIKKYMLFKSKPSDLTVVGEKSGSGYNGHVDHLSTFVGGMIGIGAVKNNPNWTEDLRLSGELAKTYYKTYVMTATGVGPEVAYFNGNENSKVDFSISDSSYRLRPESIESVYVAYKTTGLPQFRDYVWEMFQNVNKSCYMENGYGQLSNVNNENGVPGRNMESFFLAETLKYAYLTFCDSSVMSATKWIFNTEAHPLRVWNPETVKEYSMYLSELPVI